MSKGLSAERLSEIAGRLAAIEEDAPAPWSYDDSDGDVYDAGEASVLVSMTEEAAVLVAHAPADLTDLLAEVKRLRAEVEARFTAEEVVAVHRDNCWEGGPVNRVSRDVMEMSARVRRRAYDAFHAARTPEATP